MASGRTLGDVFFGVRPDTDRFGPELDKQVGGETKRRGRGLGAGFGRAFAGGALIAAAGIGKFLSGALGEARESQKVNAITAQVVKTTGGIANITAAGVGKLTSALSKKIGVDDEAIQAGANLLLTFKNVRNEVGQGNAVFDRATAAAADLSAAGFGSITGASKQLGKALNDPVKGIAALSRSGVTFTEQQKQQIKTLVASGDTLSAQKIILKEVESQVGGTAAAAATGGDKFKVAFGNFQEAVGTLLLPVLDKVFSVLTPLIVTLTGKLGPALQQVGAFIGQVFGRLASSGGAEQAAGIFDKIKAAVVQLLPTLIQIGSAIVTNVLPVVQAMATTFVSTILPAVGQLVSYVNANLVPILVKIGGIVATQVVPILATFGRFIYTQLIPAVLRIVAAVVTNLKPVFDQLVATFQTQVLPALQRLLAKFQQYQPAIQRIVLVVVKVIGAVLRFAAAILAKVLPPLIRFAGFLIGRLFGAIGFVIGALVRIATFVIRVGTAFVNAVKKVAQFQAGMVRIIGAAIRYVAGVPGKILNALGNLGGLLKGAGGAIIDGLVSGIRNAGSKVAGVVRGIIDKIPKAVRKIMGIASPSKVMAGLGRFLPAGLAKGILDGSPAIDKAVSAISARMTAKAAAELSIPAPTGRPRSISGAAFVPRGTAGAGGQATDMTALVAMLVAALNGLGLELVVDGTKFGAYIRAKADGSVNDARDLDNTLARTR